MTEILTRSLSSCTAQCQRFTPMLATWYSVLKSQGVNLEIVFISSDKDEESVSIGRRAALAGGFLTFATVQTLL